MKKTIYAMHQWPLSIKFGLCIIFLSLFFFLLLPSVHMYNTVIDTTHESLLSDCYPRIQSVVQIRTLIYRMLIEVHGFLASGDLNEKEELNEVYNSLRQGIARLELAPENTGNKDTLEKMALLLRGYQEKALSLFEKREELHRQLLKEKDIVASRAIKNTNLSQTLLKALFTALLVAPMPEIQNNAAHRPSRSEAAKLDELMKKNILPIQIVAPIRAYRKTLHALHENSTEISLLIASVEESEETMFDFLNTVVTYEKNQVVAIMENMRTSMHEKGRQVLYYVAFLTLIIGFFLCVIMYSLIKTVRDLALSIEYVAGGNLDHPITKVAHGDLGRIVDAANTLRLNLKNKQTQHNNHSQQ